MNLRSLHPVPSPSRGRRLAVSALASAAALATLLTGNIAFAQGAPPAAAPAPAVPPAQPMPGPAQGPVAQGPVAQGPAAQGPMQPQAPMAPMPPAERDGVRFRGAIQLEAGALLVPEFDTSLGYGGVSGQLGVQINNLVGVYAVPTFDIVGGAVGGVHLAAGAVVDFTFGDIVSVGVGPDVALFAAVGAGTAAAGALYGGRLRASVYPVLDKGANGYRRKALAIGVDLRLMSGPVATANVNQNGTSGNADDDAFVISPQLTIGYQAF